MKMHLPTLAPQRSVLKAAFLYDYEMLLGSGDFLNVYHRCSLSRVVPISKRKEVRVSWIPEKVVCFMYVGGASCRVNQPEITIPCPTQRTPNLLIQHISWNTFYWVCILLVFCTAFKLGILQSSPCLLHMLSVLDPSDWHYCSDQDWE